MNNTPNDEDLYKKIDEYLSTNIDPEILKNLDIELEKVAKKSKALASSLKRCFSSARKSYRYVEAYKLGAISRSGVDLTPNQIEDELKDFFEKNDFMHYREYVRLLRACTIDVGGDVSSNIKELYNNFFSGKRLVEAYKLGAISRSGVDLTPQIQNHNNFQ